MSQVDLCRRKQLGWQLGRTLGLHQCLELLHCCLLQEGWFYPPSPWTLFGKVTEDSGGVKVQVLCLQRNLKT